VPLSPDDDEAACTGLNPAHFRAELKPFEIALFTAPVACPSTSPGMSSTELIAVPIEDCDR